MNHLTFRKSSNVNLLTVNQNDVFEFMATVTGALTLNPKGNETNLHIEKIEESEGANLLMTRVKISFRVFSDNVTYTGIWETHRAKDFSCQNISHKIEKL